MTEGMLELSVSPVQVWAYSAVEVRWNAKPGNWDYVTLRLGKRSSWYWCNGKQAAQFTVYRPGEYEVQYWVEGGYLSSGSQRGSLQIHVQSPLLDFVSPRDVQAGEAFEVSWSLADYVGERYTVLMQTDDEAGAADVSIQSLQMRLHTDSTSLIGRGRLVAPRVAGKFNIVVRGTGDADSDLLQKQFQVRLPDLVRRATFIQVLTASGAKRAVVVGPGAIMDVEWSFPLTGADDMIWMVPGDVPPKTTVQATMSTSGLRARIAGTAGTLPMASPCEAGQYCICMYAGYRSGQVMLLSAFCQVFVTALADAEPGVLQGSRVPDLVVPPPVAPPYELAVVRPQCIICMSADINAMVEPCCHAQFCCSCLQRSLSQRPSCPVCRNRASGHKVIFLP